MLDFGAVAALVAPGSQDPSAQCISQNVWDVTQGVDADVTGSPYCNSAFLGLCPANVWGSALLVAILVASTVCLLLGGKLVKPCLFIGAFLVGYYVSMSITFLLQQWIGFDACTVPLCVGVVVGIVAGITMLNFLHLTVFIAGAFVGVVGAIMAKQLVLSFVGNCTGDCLLNVAELQNWYWLVAAGCGILCGCCLRVEEAKLLAVSTAVVGAWGVAISLMPLFALWADKKENIGLQVRPWCVTLTFCIALAGGIMFQLKH